MFSHSQEKIFQLLIITQVLKTVMKRGTYTFQMHEVLSLYFHTSIAFTKSLVYAKQPLIVDAY